MSADIDRQTAEEIELIANSLLDAYGCDWSTLESILDDIEDRIRDIRQRMRRKHDR